MVAQSGSVPVLRSIALAFITGICARRADPAPQAATEPEEASQAAEADEQEAVIASWRRVTRRLLRLAYKRRCWASLGNLLNQIKKQGRDGGGQSSST